METKICKPFTMEAIKRIPPASPGKRDTYHHPKIQGLKIRVTDKGARTFFFEARGKGGIKANETIGKFPQCTVDQAEAEAKRLQAQMVEGIDPRAARKKAKKDPTFEDLFKHYLESGGKRKIKDSTRANYEWLFTKHLEGLAKSKASSLLRADVRALHVGMTKNHGAYVANRVLVLVRAVYNKALADELVTMANPAAGIGRNPEESREVRLLPSQLQAFLAAVDSYPDEALRDFFTLCILTGQRRAYIQAMRWEDVHLRDRLWIIPETKNGKPQTVPLLDAEVAILERRKKTALSPWVFPSHGKSGHLVEPKAAWKAILDKAGIEHGALRIHDLRRTLGSLMVDSGASLPTIGKALGHMSQLTTAIYARMALDPVREAKGKAHAVIEAARDGFGGKVVEMPPKKRGAAR